MKYQDNSEVRPGDEVLVWDKPAFVKFIVTDSDSPLGGWYFNQHGPGVMFEFDGGGEYYTRESVLRNAEDITFLRRRE
ncbi:MAG: hypothetical protein JWL69_5033 [Phycisphaerales bacterium]|nr:hypothetical protein [Phycisphaerales bacterium]MDB5330215.1 hypothetical protein [Phycisphaerales bacterium]MDB5353696.1 hypothetical protein [Phycisphaerales bacterium]